MSSTNDIEEILAPYLSAQLILTLPISSLSTIFFIYGICVFQQCYSKAIPMTTLTAGLYCFIFGLSIRILFRKTNPVHKLQTGGTIALFILATIYTIVDTWGLSRQAFIAFHAATTKDYTFYLQYLEKDSGKTAWEGIINVIATLMNSISDMMLIHRCYLIFNSNKLVLFPLVCAACILNGIDFGCSVSIPIGYSRFSKSNDIFMLRIRSIGDGVGTGIVVFQIILALLTGGRIWWITSQARQLMGESTRTRYNDIVAIVIESGLLYAGSLLTKIVAEHKLDPQLTGFYRFDFTIITILMAGLTPTMVIARVVYGKSVESIQQTISTFHAGDAQTSQHRSIPGIRRTTIDLQIQTQSGIIVSNLQEVEEPLAIPAAVDKV